jgi:hypothetical protein
MGLRQRWIDELKGTFNVGWLAGAAAATLGVLGLTHIPQPAIPRALQFDRFDKVEHVAAYGMITVFCMLALKVRPEDSIGEQKRRRRWEVRGWLGLAVLIVLGLAAIGAVDELTQPYVNRTCSIWDWAGDVVGIVAVCTFFVVKRTIVDPQRALSTMSGKGKSR